ncbi:hypothetical protein [Miltoncostaea oceani]|jgi:hypothetical protein|uniref:hypothetical protein n=1 Tax=Miltoncostaea oceani TaxID=2843216 RepID=UPI001C3CC250|nr:hypothetical protein [Miltoncostaea oceani]
MSTIPPPGSGAGPQPPEEGVEPASAVGGGTHTPSDAMTRYDKEKDAYHCSYGIPSPALAVLDPERELIVRVDRHSFRVVGFSIPNFTEWVAKHGDDDGNFGVELPEVWPMEQTDTSGSTAPW